MITLCEVPLLKLSYFTSEKVNHLQKIEAGLFTQALNPSLQYHSKKTNNYMYPLNLNLTCIELTTYSDSNSLFLLCILSHRDYDDETLDYFDEDEVSIYF